MTGGVTGGEIEKRNDIKSVTGVTGVFLRLREEETLVTGVTAILQKR